MCQAPGHQGEEISTSLFISHPQEAVKSNKAAPQSQFFYLSHDYFFPPYYYSTSLVTEDILLFSVKGIFPFTCMLGQCVEDFKVLFSLTCQNKVTSTNIVARCSCCLGFLRQKKASHVVLLH